MWTSSPASTRRDWKLRSILKGAATDPAKARQNHSAPLAGARGRGGGAGGGACACARPRLPARGWGGRWGGGCDVRCARGSGCAGTAGISEGGRRADALGCWWPPAPRCGSCRRRRLAPPHHVRPAGALRARVARAGGRISGIAGRAGPPGRATPLPAVQCLPLPANPAGAVGTVRAQGAAPGWALGAGGPRGPAPSYLPALQFFIHLGRPVEAPHYLAFAPALCSAHLLLCRKLVCGL